MKNLTIAVAVTALIAFALGYVARGPVVERVPNVSTEPERSADCDCAESAVTQTQTTAHAELRQARPPSIADVDREDVITSTSSTPRAAFVKNKSDMLGDFFLINGIGTDRAEQIVQDLVDADHYIAEKANAMINRRAAENAELIARGDSIRITHTEEEKAEIKAEQETLHRQVFGEYYEAYDVYSRSYPQRRRVGLLSATLTEPLEYSTKETIVQIMFEEHSRFETELESERTETGVHILSAPQARAAEVNKNQKQLLARRAYNNRVMDRTKAYLSPSQFSQFEKFLDDDVRRFELMIEMMEIDAAY